MKNKKLSIFLKGLILENPVLVLVLGTCPTLAQTGSVIQAFGMGIAATIVLICSNVAISLLRKVIPDTVRIPCYIVIIAGFVTVVQLLMHAYLPALYEMMGVYLALIVVNCIILGRAEMFARKNGVLDSALDGAGMGLGFLIALLAMATIREVFGAGSFAGFAIPFLKDYTVPILTQAPGGFLVFGILIAIINKIGVKKGAEKRKEFSCEGCPSAALCGKTSCSELQELTEDIAENEKEENA
ncbi:MAG: electron transport complex subunit E [Clostridia bacterium]|nr:electron transport complex subunit E [Clostridia bacterium]